MKTTTKERPIIMHARSVKAILEGRKSMTRRCITRLPGFGKVSHFEKSDTKGYDWRFLRGACWNDIRDERLVPPWEVGSRLWVREAWRAEEVEPGMYDGIRFAADNAFVVIPNTPQAADRWCDAHDNGKYGNKWRSPMFMPRWASRLTLEVVSVRVERVQEISRDDVMAEGYREHDGDPMETIVCGWHEPFAAAWDSLNAKRGFGWDANPYVWVVEFRRVEGEVDA